MSDGYLMHYGKGHLDGGHSGRYPWGSGDDPYQHQKEALTHYKQGTFRKYIKELKDDYGLTEKEISKGLKMPINEIRDRIAIEKSLSRNIKYEKALKMHEQGKTYTEIAKAMGDGATDNSIRSLLDPIKNERNNIAISTANMLKEEIDNHGMTNVGAGMSNRLGISETRLKTAIRVLELEGYNVYNIPVSQNGKATKTQMKVICPPDMTWGQATKNKANVNIVNDPYTEDGGLTWEHIQEPMPIANKRVYVRYKDEGGADKDGMIEIRPNVPDLDIGKHGYAQVRISVSEKDNPKTSRDGSGYMKGMAVYSNTPESKKIWAQGYDVIYNSNKSREDPLFGKVFKPFKEDNDHNIMWDNPFGANIKSPEVDEKGNIVREVGQKHYIDENGKKQLSPINIVNEAGDWAAWSKRLSAQFLSKQRPELAEKQLGIAYDKKKREFDLINSLDNPEIKMKLLESFAEDCESAAVHMKAAPLPHQQSHALLPIPSLKDNEVFAPNYRDGEIVSLVRHPHEGTYQIPTLIVNNSNREAKSIIGLHAPDAIGINPTVANQLSGADFDGDSVIVIPNPNRSVVESISMKDHPQFRELSDFNTKIYAKSPDMPITGMKKVVVDKNGNKEIVGDGFQEQKQMGMISNLIMDMTLAGAKPEELVRATKHSMVIIDSEKHNLDWRRSEKENNIKALKEKYQPGGGTGTIITRAKSQERVPERKPVYKNMIDPETGEIHYVETGRKKKEYNPKTGKYELTDKPVLVKSTKMEEAFIRGDDAYSLSSGTKMEAKYADFANRMHALANDARKTRYFLENTKYNKEMKEKYAPEVANIMAKINEARKHKPLEQKVQAIADIKIRQLKEANEDLDKEDLRKHRARIVKEARARMGTTKDHKISLSEREWEAIKSGALTHSKINDLFSLMDVEVVKKYATPKNYTPKLSKSEIAYAKTLLKNDSYTNQEIADMFGVSVSTLMKAVDSRKE